MTKPLAFETPPGAHGTVIRSILWGYAFWWWVDFLWGAGDNAVALGAEAEFSLLKG